MSQAELRRRMRGSDAMFLYFERKEMPLHIGAVAILDGPFDEESERMLAARLPELPRYRQRVLFPPFNLSHPFWEYDPDFNIRNHIRRVKLEPPGTEDQLSQLSGQIFTELMDRTRPLWDVTVVDGVEGGRSALIVRVHHCLVDGVSGVGLLNIMFDPTREPRKVEPLPYDPPPLPEPNQLMVEGLSGIWVDMAERLIGSQLTLLRIAQAFAGEHGGQSAKALLSIMPELVRPTDRLPFNRPCSGVRGHCWTAFPFGEARAIRSMLGGTINDVVLTALTGAYTRYVQAHREPVKLRFVRMMVPVSLRGENPREAVGNDISMLPLAVPLDIENPIERLRVITQRSGAMKAARVADIVNLIGTSLGWTPPYLQQPLAGLPFMPQGPVMIVNTVCTNVPGPMVPLYTNGRELLSYYPHVPCGSDAGLSVAVASYNQSLFYGVTYDMQAAPDGELFRDFIVESYEELRSAAGVPSVNAAKAARAPAHEPVAATDLRAHREQAAAPPLVRAAAAAAEPVVEPEVAQPPVVTPFVAAEPAAAAPAPVIAKPPVRSTEPAEHRPSSARPNPHKTAVAKPPQPPAAEVPPPPKVAPKKPVVAGHAARHAAASPPPTAPESRTAPRVVPQARPAKHSAEKPPAAKPAALHAKPTAPAAGDAHTPAVNPAPSSGPVPSRAAGRKKSRKHRETTEPELAVH